MTQMTSTGYICGRNYFLSSCSTLIKEPHLVDQSSYNTCLIYYFLYFCIPTYLLTQFIHHFGEPLHPNKNI